MRSTNTSVLTTNQLDRPAGLAKTSNTLVPGVFHAAFVTSRGKGKVENFSADQIQALKRAITRIYRERKLSQADLAKQLSEKIGVEVSQQTVGLLVGKEERGMAYTTATAVAKFLGFVGIDDFFEKMGVELGPAGKKRMPIAKSDPIDFQIAEARRHAWGMGISDEAIENVLKRLGRVLQAARRWVTFFSLEQDAIDEKRMGDLPPVVPPPMVKLPGGRRPKPPAPTPKVEAEAPSERAARRRRTAS